MFKCSAKKLCFSPFSSSKSHIEQEKQTISLMIHLYCRLKEGNDVLCPSCRELLDYAEARLSRCPFGEGKTTCQRCPVHCYKPEMQQRIREVMRYAGPRMLFYHPVIAVQHLLQSLFVRKPRRRQRKK